MPFGLLHRIRQFSPFLDFIAKFTSFVLPHFSSLRRLLVEFN